MQYRGVPEKEEREKGSEKVFEEMITKNFLTWDVSYPNPGSTESPRQDKSKEEHIESHGNQSDKNLRQIKNIKSNKAKKITYKGTLTRI